MMENNILSALKALTFYTLHGKCLTNDEQSRYVVIKKIWPYTSLQSIKLLFQKASKGKIPIT